MPPQEPDIETVLAGSAARARWWRRPRALGLLALALLLLGGALYYRGGAGGAPEVRYVTQPATRGALVATVTATGTIQPINKVEVSSELSGIIRDVKVDFNDTVVKGQVLAQLDTDKLDAQVEHSRATLAARNAKVNEAEVTVTETQRQYERMTKLAAGNYTSEQGLEQARAAYERALAALASTKADVKVAEADLRTDETNLRKASILASIDGVVLARNVEAGQTVATSLQAPVLFTLAEDLRRMELQVDVDEADIGKVAVGQKATFTVEAHPDHKFPATITKVYYASQTVEGVVTYTAILQVDNSDLQLRPGMTATAEIVVDQVRDALLIPNAALRYAPAAAAKSTSRSLISRILPRPPARQQVPKPALSEDGRRSVWLLRGNEPVQVYVATGLSDGFRTQVLDGGIEAGSSLIVDTRS